jgi:membrane associated rhomboid family serine protease
MLLIPLKANLTLVRVPLITYAVMTLCVLIYIAQWDRETAIQRSADEFCQTQAQWHEPDSVRGILLDAEAECAFWLSIIHFQPSRGWALEAVAEDFSDIYPESDPVEVAAAVEELYGRFALDAPASLDALLMYDPRVPNPWRMVTSSLSHADFMHLLGNLLFFFAFAGSVEIALGNARRYVAVLLALAVITSLAYSLTMITSPYRIPSLGLSGVVTGMIGLFAWLMPWARIRTFVWIFFYISIWLIPAWVLALWFVGWDIVNMMRMGSGSGINYVAHISGGIGGYLIGRYWFRQLKEDIAPLVADEIEHRRADRADTLGIMDSRRVSTDTTESMAWNRDQALGLDRLLERVHGLASTHQPGAATAMLIDELPAFGDSLELHAQVMERLFLWPPNRTTLDFARTYIHRLLTLGKQNTALAVCEKGLGHSPMFRLADPQEALRLADFAEECGRHDLALALVRDFETRYEGQGDSVRAGFMEARMLWEHGMDREAARSRIQPLLVHREHALHPEMLRFARTL